MKHLNHVTFSGRFQSPNATSLLSSGAIPSGLSLYHRCVTGSLKRQHFLGLSFEIGMSNFLKNKVHTIFVSFDMLATRKNVVQEDEKKREEVFIEMLVKSC